MITTVRIREKYPFQFLLRVSVVGFVLNLIWEVVQCSTYFRHLSVPLELSAMVYVSIGDVIMMWAVYGTVSLLTGSATWFLRDWNGATFARIAAIGSLIAIGPEIWSLKSGRWAYTENNPVIPLIGVSVLPLLQMSLISSISMYFAKRNLKALADAKLQQKEFL